MMRTLAALLIASAPCVAADLRPVGVVWEGMASYDQGVLQNVLSSELRLPSVAAGYPMDAISLHPEPQGRGRLAYQGLRLSAERGRRLFLITHASISDGVQWGDVERAPDGVEFTIAVDDEDACRTYLTESTWRPLVAPLGEADSAVTRTWSGDIAFTVDAGPNDNAAYDWAQYGEPLIVSVDGRPLATDEAVLGPTGVLIARVGEGEGAIRIEGLDDGEGLVLGVTARLPVTGEAGWTYLLFDLSGHAECGAWRWRADGIEVYEAYGGAFEPEPAFEWAGPAQAVTCEGEPLRWRVVVRNTGRGTHTDQHLNTAVCQRLSQRVGRIAPGEVGVVEFDLGPHQPGPVTVEAGLETAQTRRGSVGNHIVWPALPDLPLSASDKAQWVGPGEHFSLLQNPSVRLLIGPEGGALLYSRVGDAWSPTGTVYPWIEVPFPGAGSRAPSLQVERAEETDDGLVAHLTGSDADFAYGVELHIPNHGVMLDVRTHITARAPIEVDGVWGPAIRVGDRCTGASKGVAIFPGLEYLDGEEVSSSRRDLVPPHSERWVPHPLKITVPLVLVETSPGGPVVVTAWDPRQEWRHGDALPTAAFASPDRLTYQDNHLLQLMLPSVPDLMPENARRASEPLLMVQDETWEIRQTLMVGVPNGHAEGAFAWYEERYGFPPPEAPPRSFVEEMALGRHALMHTCWDAEAGAHTAIVNGPPENAPGLAALMLMDALTTPEGPEQAAVLDRVRQVAEATMEASGEAGLASSAACHIMRWELPYHYGHIDGALEGMRAQAYGAMAAQQPDGGWAYFPGPGKESLGAPGTRVIGVSAHHAYVLAKWVAISGDLVAEEALHRGLESMEGFRVPRGASGWECPILQPDMLAAANAVRAYTWAYAALGEERWLERARQWAHTGLAFNYAWDDGARPGMRYASIAEFGSTFFHHSWIGLPVQWCGLVYAYGVQELLRHTEDDILRRQAEGLTVSAMHQQWPWDGDDALVGTYPDSFGEWFTVRNPVHINPEDIMVNLLALNGLDPGLRSVRLPTPSGDVHLTAPADVNARVTGEGLRATLSYLPDRVFYITLGPVAEPLALSLRVNGEELHEVLSLSHGAEGWRRDRQTGVLCLGVRSHADGLVVIEAAL